MCELSILANLVASSPLHLPLPQVQEKEGIIPQGHIYVRLGMGFIES
jgi:hypothetical protein